VGERGVEMLTDKELTKKIVKDLFDAIRKKGSKKQ
jgi:hypothetical protein